MRAYLLSEDDAYELHDAAEALEAVSQALLLARDASPEISGEHLSALLRVIHRQIEQVRTRARWEPNAA